MRLSWVRGIRTRSSPTDPSAALHTSKDLAVSPLWFPIELSPKGSLCFRSGRLCSHLVYYYRRELPATLLLINQGVSGRSSSYMRRSSCVAIMQHRIKYASYERGITSSSPISTLFALTNPAFVSTTNQAGVGEANDCGKVSGETFSSK